MSEQGTMGEARVPFSAPSIPSIHQRTIALLIVSQRLLGAAPMIPDWFHDQFGTINKLMARVRITEEVIEDLNRGPFVDAMREQVNGLMHDIATHSWVKP